jgi:hypothetical protein
MVTNSRGCLSLPLARPLSEDEMPEQLKAFLKKARTSWLPNTAVLALLEGCREFGLSLCAQPPSQPPGELTTPELSYQRVRGCIWAIEAPQGRAKRIFTTPRQ